MFKRNFAAGILVVLFLAQGTAAYSATPAASGKPTLAPILRELRGPTVQMRVHALNQLAALGPIAAHAVPAIIDAVNENRAGAISFDVSKPVSPSITDAALKALKAIGPRAHDAAPYITPLLSDRNELFRRTQVLETLQAIGPSSDSSPVIMRVAAEEGKFTRPRCLAINLLGKIDPPATDATDMLREIAEDTTDKEACTEANKALDSILRRMADNQDKGTASGDQQMRKLRAALAPSSNEDTKREAFNKINELGQKAGALVPSLMPLIKDKNGSVRHNALEALGSIKQGALAAVPALINAYMMEKDTGERGYIARAVCKIDPTGARTLPLLLEPLEDPFKARLAIEILQELGTDQTTTLAQKARQRWRIKQ